MTWRERIAAARERGRFTAEDRTLAGSWETCAVGEQRHQHPAVVLVIPGHLDLPADFDLQVLGGRAVGGFALAVQYNRPHDADVALDAIEDRVLQLKRELPT